MAKTSIPAGLPDTALLRALAKKTSALKTAQARKPAYLEWLKALRDRVAPELSYTNVTFPLFTPHDEQNHIHPLFVLAERLLGSEVIDSLHATELFILACSLYAHDWGMAVSEAEKKCLLGLSEPTATDCFVLPHGDRAAFAKLLKASQLTAPLALSDVPLELWQAYVRKTHAARSACRVRAFFSSIDANLGDTVALVSEGHNLDVERLRPFETALPLQGEAANIRALALYLRLIDLFDLAQDRTPYALWKFVSPDDPKSAEEWNKHRALAPVVIEQFQKTSRCIKVRGVTDDHRVYAALEDLRDYCDSQLRLSNGLLNQLEHRYQPRLLYLDWKVEPKGFEPISVRFNFERQAMINVLSDEIYRGDQHVFLRELLQNSIDAIRLRRALHQSKKTGVTFDGAIRVKVDHQGEGRATVSWTDNGCGMSAFIVRNYLTVAGRSYYRSEDFHKLGVQMDPISRFGIGILSCFVVTDSLEITTRQDPQIEISAEALRIEVHNPKRHLRIERLLSDDLLPVGTTVRVFVGSIARKEQAKAAATRLNVTEYLKDIAGFVEFPIHVEEEGTRTIIVHPDHAGAWRNAAGWEIATLDRSFPWQDFFLPQDVRGARHYFTEEAIHLKPTATNPLFEGTISFLVLREDIELLARDGVSLDTDIYVAVRGTEELGAFRIRRRLPFGQRRSGKPRSSDCDNMCRIYCDGLLVAGVGPSGWTGGPRGLGKVRCVLNIRGSAVTKLDIARHDIAPEEQKWNAFLARRYLESCRRQVKLIVEEFSPKESLWRLARFVSYGCSGSLNLTKLIGGIGVPLLVLEKGGKIAVRSSTALLTATVDTVPYAFVAALASRASAIWGSEIPWSGGPCLFAECAGWAYSVSDVSTMRDGSTMSLNTPISQNSLDRIHEAWFGASHVLFGVRFLSPGELGKPLLMQEIWLPKKPSNRKNKDRGPVAEPTTTVVWPNEELVSLDYGLFYHAPKFVQFQPPFDKFFTAGWHYVNVLHPLANSLARCIKAIAKRKSLAGLTERDLGTICDTLQPLFGFESCPPRDDYLSGKAIEERWEQIRRLFNLVSEMEIFDLPAEMSWASEALNVPFPVKAGKQGAPIQSVREVGLA